MSALSPYKPREGRLRMDQLSTFAKSRPESASRRASPSTTSTDSSSSNSKPIGLSTEEMDLILQIAKQHGKEIGGGKKKSRAGDSMHASAPNLSYDPNEDGDDDDEGKKPSSTKVVQKPFSIEEELCSERKFMNRSKARSQSIAHAPSSISDHGGQSILDGAISPRQRSRSILGSTEQASWQNAKLNASAPNLSFDPFADDSEEEEDMDAMLQSAKALHRPRSKSLVERPNQNKQEGPKQRSQSVVATTSLSDHMTKVPGRKKKKKRILVRASELGISCPPSDGTSFDGGSIDSKEIEEAVKRWSSGLKDVPTRRKSMDGSATTDCSMIPQSPEKQRNSLRLSERRRSASRQRSKSRSRSSTDDTSSTEKRSNRGATPSRARSQSIGRDANGRSRSVPRTTNDDKSSMGELVNDGKVEGKDNDNVGFVVKSRRSQKTGSYLEDGKSDESLELAVAKNCPQAPKSPSGSSVKSSVSEGRVKAPSRTPSLRRGVLRSNSADLSGPISRATNVADDFDVLSLGIISKDQLRELKKAGFYIAKS